MYLASDKIISIALLKGSAKLTPDEKGFTRNRTMNSNERSHGFFALSVKRCSEKKNLFP